MYNDEFFDTQYNRLGTNCRKWDQACAQYGEDLIPLFVADMDFRSPKAISDALVKRAAHQTYGYSYKGSKDLEFFCEYMHRHHHFQVKPEHVCYSPSVVTGLKLAVRAFSEVGHGVVIQTPVYGPFYSSIELNQRLIIENPLIVGAMGTYSMDLVHLETLFKQGHRTFMLCNPHNPVSRCWRKEELKALLLLAQKYNVNVISDEIHADFVYEPLQFTSIMQIADELGYANVICLYAPSKTFNVAGLQQSMLVSKNEQILARVQQDMNAHGIETGNIFGMIAASVAFSECDDWLAGLKHYLTGSKELLVQELHTHLPKIKVTPIEATFLAWMDCREYGLSCSDLMKRTTENKVLFTEGTFFSKTLGEGFMRFNFGCPRKNIVEGVQRLKRSLEI